MTQPILEVTGLSVTYPVARRSLLAAKPDPFAAVKDVSFEIAPGETLALVGESGSGKSTIGNAVLGLAPIAAGHVRFEGRDLATVSVRERQRLARELQVVFQNPFGSLNPSLTIGQILTEPLQALGGQSRSSSRERIAELLERVGMPEDAAHRYPGNFSGGQRQRIAIARALAVSPKLIVCDEPTSALDVSTQLVVLELLTELREQNHLSYLFITHDLAVVRHFAHRVAVLRRGEIVEVGSAADVCENPQHPYTQRLVAAAPVPDPVLQSKRRAARLAAGSVR
ncbi:ATP-binding cassette domain-containing protein [Rathayibacter sp. Leaf296]|uniref:ATP-binding cassette domain-containing protein n=1 Tax=Rathayibacter sp. Leaf296 TaxID=1736327 RepID=UPI00070315B9|nr:ATP-binding cassette domain-containing protein [Rathayibacter sp. Leaf296]KQQ08488.1 peptide ABC transporter ATP-binding protein [Rathayibacter sp. Leaf296]